MNSIFSRLAVLGVALMLFAGAVGAQSFTHSVYFDVDRNPATGCSVVSPAGTVSGAEARVTATVTGQPPLVTTVVRETCAAGVFGSPQPQPGGYPVGLNNGIAGADVVEFSTSLSGIGANGPANLSFLSSSATGADLVTVNGVVLPGLGTVVDPAIIPATGLFALILLVGFVLWLARRHPAFGSSLAVLLLLGAGVAWAANFVMDGQVGDWVGETPRATDSNADSSSGEGPIEITAAFAELEAGRLFLRVDVRDAQNQPPVANAQAVNLFEEGTLTIVLTGSDPEAAALTFAIGAAPTRGTLSAITPIDATSASVDYTGDLDEVGADSFTFTVSDGVSTSPAATVSITLNPVNDAPSLNSVDPPAVLEDSGAASVPNWAVFVAGPADEAAQTAIAYVVTAVGTPALFSVQPSVAANGTLSYTPAPNANGTSTFSVTVQDNGGVANGGIDTSTAQTYTISVTAVNDAPNFTAGPDVSVAEDAGPQTVAGWATALDDGDPEVTQGLSFVTGAIGNAALFSAAPSVNANGDLSFTPAPNANGSSTVEVRIQDDGGTLNGGVNTSLFQSFTINVTPVDDAPAAVADSATVAEDAAASTINVLANDTDIDAGAIAISAVTQPANGTVVNNGSDLSYTPDADYCNTDPLAATDDFTYTLVPGGSVATVSVTVTCVNDAPVNTVPGAQNVGAAATLTFAAANTNAISVADVDAGGGVVQITLGVDDGTLALNPAAIAALDSLSGQGTDTVVATGTLVELNAALEGATYTAPAVPPPPPSTVTLSLDTDDLGNTGTGGAQTDSDTITIAIDDAPAVQSIVPANGASQQATNVDIVVTFTEAVDATAGAVSVTCAPSGATLGSTVQANVTSITLLGGSLGADEGDTCTVTVLAASVTDVDTIDPPDQMAADVVSSFGTDVAPAFIGSTPAEASTVATDIPFSASFSEPVTGAAGAITLDCGGPVSGTLSGSGTATLVFTPDADLPAGTNCTATLVAASIIDVDSGDPPDALPADVTINFATDAAPAVTGGTPLDTATQVATTTAVTFTFSEAVDAAAGAITLDCAGAIAGTLSGSGSATLTFTPSAPLPEATLCTATAVAANIDDSDAIDSPDALPADVARNFTTDAAPAVTGTTPNDGDTGVSLLGVVTFSFSEPVNFSGASFTYLCNSNPVAFNVAGDGTATATLTPTGLLPINTPCTVTALATGIDDVDAGDPPANLAADVVVDFTSVDDNPPSVTASTPDAGTPVVASDVAISFTMSEPVDAAADYATLTCGGPNLITAGQTGSNTTTLTPAYAGPLPAGANCTLTLLAAAITDVDAIDPPDAMVADYVVVFAVDEAPAVAATSPANGATDVATGATITFDFTESVDIASAAAFSVECPVGLPIGYTVTTPAALPASASSYTLTPAAPLPPGTTCTIRAFAAQVADTDAIDPPQNMAADYAGTFTTDAAPEVTAITPAAAAVVSTTQAIQVDFSEAVDLSATAFTLDCGGAVAFSAVPALPATATTTITLTPTGGLPEGSACVFTVVASEVIDSDSNDPPNTMLADVVRNFSVDAAPSVLDTVPADGATDVLPTSSITINFSEAVTFDTTANAANTSFDLECPAATPTDFIVLTGSPAASVVLNPLDSAVAGATCTLTVRAAGIADADLVDPPQNLAADVVVTISFAAVAEDDSFAVTPHLSLSIPAGAGPPQGGSVLVNDTLGSGTITGFGFSPACTGTVPGNQLDAGAANGRLTLNLDGSLAYEPPAGVANATRTFCYTVTGGDTANIAFNLQNTELVWFVDAAAAVGGIGTQARPFQTANAAGAVDTAADTIYIASGSYAATELVLEDDEDVIGAGSTQSIADFTGITPVAGSSFPTLSGVAPVLSCSDETCVRLSNAVGNVNRLRGFTIGDSGASAGRDIDGSGFGTLEVAEVTLTGNGTALDLSTGTLTGSFIDINASAGDDGISLTSVGGSWTVTQQVDIGNVSGRGIEILTAPVGTSVVFSGGTNVNKVSAGTAVHLVGNNAGAVLNFGNVVLNATLGTALFIDGSPITLTGSGGTITATTGPAIDATNATFAGGATLATVSSANSTTQGINLNNLTGNLTMNGGAITSPGGVAFQAQGTLATVSYAGNISKGADGNLVEITGAAAGNVTLSGNLTCNSLCDGIDVVNRSTGTITFSGTTKTLNTGTSAAVNLDNNDLATINFTNGGLDIDTTSGVGFNAVNGATSITVQGSNNSVTTTTGTAVNVNATTIGAGGMSFQAINSTTASASTAINLNSTGTGPFSVTGTGTAGTGGTISNKSVDAIQLNTTGGLVTLDRMILQDIGNMGGVSNTVSGHDAIQGLNVDAGLSLTGTTIRRISDNAIHGGDHLNPANATVWNGLTLSGVTIEDTNRFHVTSRGDANNEGTVRIVGLRGTVNVAGSTFRRGAEFLDIFVTAGTLTMDVTGSIFENAYREFTVGDNSPVASVGNHCIDVTVRSTSTANVTIGDRANAPEGNSFLNCRLGSVRVVNDTGSTGIGTFVVARNTFTVNDGSSGVFCNPACQSADFDFPMGGVLGWNLGTGTVNTVIENNTFTDVTNASGGVGQLSLISEGGGLHQSLIQANAFVRPGNAPMWVQARNVASSTMRLRAANNTVTGGPSLCTTDAGCSGGYPTPGLRTLFDAQNDARIDATLDNNAFAQHDSGYDPGQTVEFRALAGAGTVVCSDLTNNQSAGGYSLEQLAGTVQTVGGGTCAAGSPSATCQTVLGSRNNRGGGGVLTTSPPFVTALGTVAVTGVACPLPSGAPF
jgi:hypothetical protein